MPDTVAVGDADSATVAMGDSLVKETDSVAVSDADTEAKAVTLTLEESLNVASEDMKAGSE